MHGVQEVDSPIPRALLRSPRVVRRKPGTLGMLVLGRTLSAPVLAVFAGLLAFAVLEPLIVFLIPAQQARIIRDGPHSQKAPRDHLSTSPTSWIDGLHRPR